MKKIYQKPTMQIIELQHHTSLLQTSGQPAPGDIPLGYTPGLHTDDNHLMA